MLGAQLKQDYNKVQEEWLEDPDHLQQWEAQTISAGDRRILITLWLAEAAKRFRNRGLAACISSWERTGCGMSADGSGDEHIVVSGIPNYTFVEPVGADLNDADLRGLDEAEAKQTDPEEPSQSKVKESEMGEEHLQKLEEEEEEAEEECKNESEEESEGEQEYWVQCEIDKCQKWRKLPTPWGPEEDFTCAHIQVRCAQQCDACKGLRCLSSCTPE